MQTELVPVRFGNVLTVNRIAAVAAPDAAPPTRLVREGKSSGRIIDLTSGRRTIAVRVMDSGYVVLAAIAPEPIARRVAGERALDDGE